MASNTSATGLAIRAATVKVKLIVFLLLPGPSQSAQLSSETTGDGRAARDSLGTQPGTVNLIGSGRDKAGEAGHTNAYARAATPVTAAQVWKAWVRAARYWRAGR